ncbi:hypothetical protein FRD01_12605 [Microvenator marinus]|uniref:Mandelate racemase/muconate lactonizing enzyme C-terminal domain-containing protein n=1 Tax=Microvenator marinus TaxID=2600177 RepID=A0A5B8XR30_9DELT|nr:hypothetical protein FRD01_12605 [Microvenator marinus]
MKHSVEKKTYPFSRTFSTATRQYSSREVVHLTLWHGDVHGIGEAAPLAGWVDESVDEVSRELSDLIAGLSPGTHPLEILGQSDEKGLCCSARYALHSAIFDLVSKERGLPRWRVIREFFAAQYPGVFRDLGDNRGLLINATLSASEDSEIQVAQDFVARGFRCLKVKVGGRALQKDLDRIARLRDTFETVALRLDANQSWDKATAIAALGALDDFNIEYVEEPLLRTESWEPGELAEFRTRVAADESVRGLDDLQPQIDEGVEVFVIKPAQFGGFDTLFEARRRLQERGSELVITSSLDSIGRFFAAEVAYALGLESPCGLATGGWIEDGLEDPLYATDRGMCWRLSS